MTIFSRVGPLCPKKWGSELLVSPALKFFGRGKKSRALGTNYYSAKIRSILLVDKNHLWRQTEQDTVNTQRAFSFLDSYIYVMKLGRKKMNIAKFADGHTNGK